jgi:DNA repair exonuclease SbcCD nuclease subunit
MAKGDALSKEYSGLLCIGDPHLASRVPGFRKDDYPQAILKKLTWALNYASEHHLLPAILGDLFHWPRDNANWMLVRLLELFEGTVLGIAGNHDCKENELGTDDSLSVLSAAGRLRLLNCSDPWCGTMGGRTVVVGGTAWGQHLPTRFDSTDIGVHVSDALVIWLAHHDVRFPGYEEIGRFDPHEIPGVDIVVNGHIHRPLADVLAGTTTWVNPGNIARYRRNDVDRGHRPSILHINIRNTDWEKQAVEVPFLPYEEVFHEDFVSSDIPLDESMFVRGLAALESLKTHGGAGLRAFLEQNLDEIGPDGSRRFDTRVATEIRALAKEVYGDETQQA